jgi:acyl-CoA thioesterase FadM
MMIKLFGRMIPAMARGVSQPRINAAEPLASRFRVLPHDIDINLHLNNGRYLQIIDVNRMEFLFRAGVIDIVRKNRWKPILGSTTIQFRRELRLWDEALASTRLVGWDDRWTYLEHRIETADGKPVAIAMARAGFRQKGGWVPIETLRAALPMPLRPMVLPAHFNAWADVDDLLGGQIAGLRRTTEARETRVEQAEAEAVLTTVMR